MRTEKPQEPINSVETLLKLPMTADNVRDAFNEIKKRELASTLNSFKHAIEKMESQLMQLLGDYMTALNSIHHYKGIMNPKNALSLKYVILFSLKLHQ
jgi:hypothetical protein